MDSAPVKPEVGERCPERERLMQVWTDCSSRVRKLLDERFAATTGGAPRPTIEEQIRLARAAEVDACRAYFRHVNSHDCV
jgi:hypothetical protein